MASCKECAFYSETVDAMNRDFNDIEPEGTHYCIMYTDKIPDGVFEGSRDCPYFEQEVKNDDSKGLQA